MTTITVPMVPPELRADLLEKILWVIEHYDELPADRKTAFNILLETLEKIDEKAAELVTTIRHSILQVHGIHA